MNEKNLQNKRKNISSCDLHYIYFDDVYLKIFNFHCKARKGLILRDLTKQF